MPVYQIVASYGGEGRSAILNRYHYFGPSEEPVTAWAQIGAAWYSTMWPAIRVFTHQSYAIRSVAVSILGDENVEQVYSPSPIDPTFPGVVSGDVLPPYAAFGVRFNRSLRTTRNGQKRLPGVGEESQSGGVLTPVVLQQVQSAASSLLAFGTPDNDYALHIVRFSPLGVLVTSNPALSATASSFVTTQNSRKIGR